MNHTMNISAPVLAELKKLTDTYKDFCEINRIPFLLLAATACDTAGNPPKLTYICKSQSAEVLNYHALDAIGVLLEGFHQFANDGSGQLEIVQRSEVFMLPDPQETPLE